MNIKTIRTLTWWQKTRLTAFIFAASGLVGVLAINGFYALAGDKNDIGRIGWIAQSVLPLLTVLAISLFTRTQRAIDLRGDNSPVSDEVLRDSTRIKKDAV